MRNLAFTITLTALFLAAFGARAEAGDKLTAKEIKRVVGRHSDEVKRCYERFAQRQRTAEGKVNLGFVVLPDGRVKRKSIDVEAPGVKGRRFYRCVKHFVGKWEFPKASNSTSVEYPFYFQHTRARGAGPKR